MDVQAAAPSPFSDPDREARQVPNVLVGVGAVAARVGAPIRALALRALPEGRRSIAAFGGEVDRGARRSTGACACAPSTGDGRRVVFGSRRAPPASVGQAVAARARSRRSSCRAHRRPAYVDGGPGRRPTPMPRPPDVAIACCCSSRPARSPAARCAERPARGRRAPSRGAAVRIVTPDRSTRSRMGRLLEPDHGGACSRRVTSRASRSAVDRVAFSPSVRAKRQRGRARATRSAPSGERCWKRAAGRRSRQPVGLGTRSAKQTGPQDIPSAACSTHRIRLATAACRTRIGQLDQDFPASGPRGDCG